MLCGGLIGEISIASCYPARYQGSSVVFAQPQGPAGSVSQALEERERTARGAWCSDKDPRGMMDGPGLVWVVSVAKCVVKVLLVQVLVIEPGTACTYSAGVIKLVRRLHYCTGAPSSIVYFILYTTYCTGAPNSRVYVTLYNSCSNAQVPLIVQCTPLWLCMDLRGVSLQ